MPQHPTFESTSGSARKQVLVAEDSEPDRQRIEAVLRRIGYEPITVTAAEQVFAALASTRPDAIVLSGDMPKGFATCHRLKRDKALRFIPVIMVSGKVSPDVLRKHRLLATRADHYLEKPVNEEALTAILADLLPTVLPHAGEEPPVSEVPDRTLVGGGLETAVVTYVEEEVSALRSRLNAKVQALEEQLAQERARLDEALKALAERRKIEADEATKKALEEAREAGRREAMDLARAQTAALESRIAQLEAALASAQAAADSARRELLENQTLFERLEAGYKQSIAAAEEEKKGLEAALDKAEEEVHALRVERDRLIKELSEMPVLREASAKCEILEEELARLSAEKQALEASVASLNEQLAEMRERLQMLEEKEKTYSEVWQRLQQAEARLAEEEAARKTAEQAVQVMREKYDQMREVFKRLRTVLDTGD